MREWAIDTAKGKLQVWGQRQQPLDGLRWRNADVRFEHDWVIERFPEKINITFMINYMPTNDDRDNQVKNNLKHVGSV